MQWKVTPPDQANVQVLVESLHIDPLVAKVLITRGITSVDAARAFLSPETQGFYDPFLMDGMQDAVDRVRQAIEAGERIRIYGDYDADGISSTSLMIQLLRHVNANFDYYIPHRFHEGYGLNIDAISAAKQDGVSLIITVDNGISAVEQIAHANELGLDVVVTDHHEPPAVLPDALCIVNPKKEGCSYPFKDLAGVGVAFKFAHALLGEVPHWLLELVTLGTVADLMPLLDENRLFVTLGLSLMNDSAYPGIAALFDVAGVNSTIQCEDVAFSLAPRINASGRLQHADTAVELLTTKDSSLAEVLAKELHQLNQQRQKLVSDMVKEALAQLEQVKDDDVIVLAGEGWNIGVIGIVAAKILEKTYRPTIILNIDHETGLAKGSARSIPAFDIYSALKASSSYMDHFGGHEGAAGMTMNIEHIDDFRIKLNEIAKEWLTEDDFIPSIDVDLECEIEEITVASIQSVQALAPFGKANPAPVVALRTLHVEDARFLGKQQNHLKLKVKGESRHALDAIYFNYGYEPHEIKKDMIISLCGELSLNEWNGNITPQVRLKDIQSNGFDLIDIRNRKLQPSLPQWLDSLRKEDNKNGIIFFSKEMAQQVQHMIQSYSGGMWLIKHDQAVALGDNDISLSEVQQCFIVDCPPSLLPFTWLMKHVPSLEKLCINFSVVGESQIPSREKFAILYKMLQQMNVMTLNEEFTTEIRDKYYISHQQLRFILSVFEELGFVEQENGEYHFIPSPQKKPLHTSLIYKQQYENEQLVRSTLLQSSTMMLYKWINEQRNEQSNQNEFMEEVMV